MFRNAFVVTSALLLVGLGTVPPAAAGHCPGLVVEAGSGYVWTNADPADGLTWAMVFLESNGIDGLQQGGSDFFNLAPACAHANPDTLLL